MTDKHKRSMAGQVTMFQLLQLIIPLGCAAGGYLGGLPFGTVWGVGGAVTGLVLGGLLAWIGVFYLAVWCSESKVIQPRARHEAALFLSQANRRSAKNE